MERLIRSLQEDPALEGSVRVQHQRPPRAARTRPLPRLPAPLEEALRRRGIEQLFTHQARMRELALAGRHAVVATGTASGKSLCFWLPMIEASLQDHASRALLLHPTKALSRDQCAGLEGLLDEVAAAEPGCRRAVHVFDGDTPPAARRALKEDGDFVLTNPWMLHTGLLPLHGHWARLFEGLRFVVVDEMHTCRGVFGSHVANVLRRLRRICAHYGSRPTFLFASATIGNPGALARQLAGEEVAVVEEDGSPSGARLFAFVQPPVVHRGLGLRRSVMDHTVRLARPLLASGRSVIFFERRRNGVEILLRYLKEMAPEVGLRSDQVRGYRGGYLPDLRREIEAGLRSGEVRCVVATNALELGVDIGALDVSVLVGYPGSVAATWQRAGRAGRRQQASLSLLVARSVATDQYLMANPDYLFSGRPEQVVLEPDNPVIRAQHVGCAAFELPFRPGEEFGGQGDTAQVLTWLAQEARTLVEVGGRYFYAHRSFPASNVSLDAGDMDNFVVLDADRRTPIGEVDRASAATLVHPEAIYQMQGEQYYVESMDYPGRRVLARKVEVDYYTEAEVDAEVRVLERHEHAACGEAERHRVEVTVHKVTTMYKKVRYYTGENIGTGDVNLPAEELDTEALALVLPDALVRDLGILGGGHGTALAAFARLLRHVVPLRIRCSPGDLGATALMIGPHFGRATVFLWDEFPGGVGLSEAAYHQLPDILSAMGAVVEGCACRAGCPACVGASLADGGREKRVVAALLRRLQEPASLVAAGPS